VPIACSTLFIALLDETPLELSHEAAQYQTGERPGVRSGSQQGIIHMYDRELSEEQRLMRQSCRDFVDEVVLPFIRGNWQREWLMVPEDRLPASILEEADKIGIRTVGVPEEFGGVELEPGTEVSTFAMIAEEIARGDSGLADKLVQNWKVSVLLRRFAPRHLQEKWFPALVANPQFLMAHCLTEPRGASDRWLPYNAPEAAMQTRAVKVDGGWRINGRKQFISNGYDASLYVVYANTNTKVGMLQGTSSFLVPRETKGFTVARCNETLGCRFMNNGEMVFEDMFIPDDQLLVQDSALGSAGVYFRPGKIIQAAKNLGVGVRAFEATADYVQNYVQGGKILIKHQAVALRLAEMATKLEAVRALLIRASKAVDDNAPEAETLVNMVKLFASEEIMKVAQHAVELHGGNGIMLDFGIEKSLRDAVIFMHMDATVDISKFKIIKNMFPDTAGKYAGPE
jgi:acyl-CoA dehydrogenase